MEVKSILFLVCFTDFKRIKILIVLYMAISDLGILVKAIVVVKEVKVFWMNE